MPVHIDQSVRAGPFRFDVQPNGEGISSTSAVTKLGVHPRAHFIRIEKGGVRYQTSVKRAGPAQARSADMPAPSRSILLNSVRMLEVESGDVLDMRNEGFSAVLDEINANPQTERLAIVLPVLAILMALLACYFLQFEFIALVLVAPALWLMGKWIDAYRRATILVYALGKEAEASFRRLIEAFDRMMACDGKWHVQAGGAITDLTTWKQHAGASRIIQRVATYLDYCLPEGIKSNVTPPRLQVGRQLIYFLPDVALIQDGTTFGAVAYADLRVHCQVSDSVEAGGAPGAAFIVGHTWEHPNISGGPDRRFRTNRQLPVCRYEAVHISSSNGVNELVEFSRQGVGQSFAAAIAALGRASLRAGPTTSYGSYGNALSLTWRPRD